MREKCSDYFENSRRAVVVQRCYAELNPHQFVGYDRNCWGLSACDGPTDEVQGVANEQPLHQREHRGPKSGYAITRRGVLLHGTAPDRHGPGQN